jgi:hypothetical protein
VLQLGHVRKADLQKKKNDDEIEEGWVQCDACEAWIHMICGLFNKGKNDQNVHYLCPSCLMRVSLLLQCAAVPLGFCFSTSQQACRMLKSSRHSHRLCTPLISVVLLLHTHVASGFVLVIVRTRFLAADVVLWLSFFTDCLASGCGCYCYVTAAAV